MPFTGHQQSFVTTVVSPRNLMATSTASGVTISYKYDIEDWRVSKTSPTSTTYYLRGPGGQLLSEITFQGTAPPAFRDYIYAGARMLAAVER